MKIITGENGKEKFQKKYSTKMVDIIKVKEI